MPLANWGTTAQKLAIWFPGRMVLFLAIRKVAELPPRQTVIQPMTQFILNSRYAPYLLKSLFFIQID